jgi:hypothetical protein
VGTTRDCGWFPQDFHTCGKHCGKAALAEVLGAENVIFRHFSWAKVKIEPFLRLSMRSLLQSNSKIQPLSRRKSNLSSGFSRHNYMDVSIWEQILSRVETKVNRHSFYTWFKPTSLVADGGQSITVRVPNTLFRLVDEALLVVLSRP